MSYDRKEAFLTNLSDTAEAFPDDDDPITPDVDGDASLLHQDPVKLRAPLHSPVKYPRNLQQTGHDRHRTPAIPPQ